MTDRLQGEHQITQLMLGAPTYANIGRMRLGEGISGPLANVRIFIVTEQLWEAHRCLYIWEG